MTKMLRSFMGLVLFFFAAAAGAQTAEQRASCERDFAPTSGQQGKDVVWVPTPDYLVTAMLKEANVTPNDLVYDLGAGDGKIAIAAAKEFGARAVGIEYNPKMVTLANCLLSAAQVGEKVKIIEGDIFKTDFSSATVVTMYLLPSLNERLIPTLWKMKPGTRIVSNSFLMGDWDPDRKIRIDGVDQAYYWEVPAKVDGDWTLQAQGRTPLQLNLRQVYQKVTGEVVEGTREFPIQEATLRGPDVILTYTGAAGKTTIKGTVDRDTMNVTVENAQSSAAYSGKLKPAR
jgi:SAM-dependent methyltransferase